MVLTIKKTRTKKGRTREIMEVIEKPSFLEKEESVIKEKMMDKSKSKINKEGEA